MGEWDHKEGWGLKNWCFWIMVLDKTLDSPLDYKETKPVNLKGNQPWTFIGRTDAEAEAPILWPPDVKSQLIGKDHDAGKDWRQEEKGTQMVGWPHRLNGHEFEQTLGDSERRGTWHAAVHGVIKSQTWLSNWHFHLCCCSVAKSCPTPFDSMDCSTPGFPVFHSLLELVQIHAHWVGDAIQPSHSLSSPFTFAIS